jgi:hypothetical protein
VASANAFLEVHDVGGDDGAADAPAGASSPAQAQASGAASGPSQLGAGASAASSPHALAPPAPPLPPPSQQQQQQQQPPQQQQLQLFAMPSRKLAELLDRPEALEASRALKRELDELLAQELAGALAGPTSMQDE